MSELEWDRVKAEANRRKHGVSFEEAKTVLNDPGALMDADPTRVDDVRMRAIGWSTPGRLLTVITSIGGSTPRLISARRASKRERDAYERRRR